MGILKIYLFLSILVITSSKPIDIGGIVKNEDNNASDIAQSANNVAVRQNGDDAVHRSHLRPGMTVDSYAIELTPNIDEGTFTGEAIIQVRLTAGSRDEAIKFYARDLDIEEVSYSIGGGTPFVTEAEEVDDGIIEVHIHDDHASIVYTFHFVYGGSLGGNGRGFYSGHYGENTYLAMNLHPIYARRVFPCMDEPTETAMIRFTFNDMDDFDHLVTNARSEDNSPNEFRAIQGTPHVFGMMAHDFININVPTTDVLLYTRRGLQTQDVQASAAIAFYFQNLNEWTNKEFSSINVDQDGRLHIVAVPDISRDWHSLSTIGIWEPNILMQTNHAVKQRKIAIFEIAQAMAKQWFGNVLTPENWRYEWVISGLASYAAYEMMRLYQEDDTGESNYVVDVNTLFVTDIIQESLLRDAYPDSQPLETGENIFDEEPIRNHLNGILKLKAPAILRMTRIVLGDPDQDFIQSAARSLLNINALQPINSLHLVSGINSDWLANGNGMIGNVDDFLSNWRTVVGYPLLHVSRRPGGVLVTLEPFSFGPTREGNFFIPITFTTSVVPDFSDFQPEWVIDSTRSIDVNIGGDDWILFNIQGQGYYRVNYNDDIWENIIEALGDPETREEIHPLNRATLVDDSMNLARAGKLEYGIALTVILTMEHETEYAVWKAFVRNMEFLRKRLMALLEHNDDLDEDIYVRMVRRTIVALEEELGFESEPNLSEPAMDTLTRGLVMEHACKANHLSCIAAAVDLFYDDDVVNPNIPHDLRPAVYCTMVREGDEEEIDALLERLEIEPTIYERVVILESLACSQDEDYINHLLQQTIADDSPYTVEERSKILAAVIESSYSHVFIAINFMSTHTPQIIDMYGGLEKFEELLFVLADNIVDDDQARQYRDWLLRQNNNLGDSETTSQRALERINLNLQWSEEYLEAVYEWIDENDASTMVLSFAALCMSIMIALINH